METMIIENIPQWAVPYIEYGDSSGLTQEEIDMIDRYRAGLADEGYRLVAPVEGSENEICAFPEFGRSCATIDYRATYHKVY